MRVGVFDSGIGGVNVLSCLVNEYPHNDYVYFGDTKNLPYGNKSKDELYNLSHAAIDFLLTKNVDTIIIACGTVSSNCYNELKEEYNIPIYDIISPTIEYLKQCDYEKIGVIGTIKTIESKVFNISNKEMIEMATPSLVPIIENNLVKENEDSIINELSCFKNCDILVLGCTHYPLLKEIFNKMKIKTLDMGEVLANKIPLKDSGHGTCELYFSQIGVNLVHNINKILDNNYQIYIK